MSPERQDGSAATSIALRMKLKPGTAAEYRRRHDQIWPELMSVLRDAGIYDYSIYLDARSNDLFAVLKLAADHRRDSLPDHPVMKRWWTSMADLMQTRADEIGELSSTQREGQQNSPSPDGARPMEWPLELMFHMD